MIKKYSKVVLLGLTISLMGLFAAQSASAYPDVTHNLTVDHQVIYGGGHFTATATSNTVCDDWTLEWNGVARHRVNTDFVTTYTAPQVTKITKIPLHGTCHYAVPGTRVAARAIATAAVWKRTIVITVLPAGSVSPPTTGGLPGTGGPARWILLLGLALAGVGAIFIQRGKGLGSE